MNNTTPLPGSRTEYLASLANAFPARDSRGYVIGYYVYDKDRRQAGPFATVEEANGVLEEVGSRFFGSQVIAGHVLTAKGRVIRASGDPAPWVSRLNGERRSEPDAFPEIVATHGMDYRPRAGYSHTGFECGAL